MEDTDTPILHIRNPKSLPTSILSKKSPIHQTNPRFSISRHQIEQDERQVDTIRSSPLANLLRYLKSPLSQNDLVDSSFLSS
ncbi:hypothetical protein YC2023_089984 [Brassica napus]